MTVLVTGATGFIGQWIVSYLTEKQDGPIRVMVRHEPDRVLDAAQVERVYADLRDPVSLERALKGVETVFHAAGLISFDPTQAKLVEEINVHGTRNLFDVALKAGVRKVVYTASIFAVGYAEAQTDPRTEDDSFNAGDLLDIPYIKAKRDAELAAQHAVDKGLPLVRLYPGLCMGPGDWHRSSTRAIDSWLHGRLPVIVGGGGICLLDVRDAARAHIAAMDYGTPGKRYLVTGHNVTLNTLFEMLSTITGQKTPLTVPPSIGIPGARLLERLGVSLPVESSQARLMARHWWYDCRYALQELKLAFRPLEETLKDTVEWLRANPSSL